METPIIRALFIATALGFMIGLQRGIYHLRKKEPSFAGARTFAIIGLLGALTGFVGQRFELLALALALTVGLILALAYGLEVWPSLKGPSPPDYGSTTHFAALTTYLLGLWVSLGGEKYAIFAGVMVIILLEIKPQLRKIEAQIAPEDLSAAVLLLASTFLVLPILPDRLLGPYQLFNPHKTWLMAVLIAGLSFVGYLSMKIWGQHRGLYLTGALGGLVSSTAVTVSMSRLAGTERTLALPAAGAIAIACTLMLARMVFLSSVVNTVLGSKLLEILLLPLLLGLVYSYLLYRRSVPSFSPPSEIGRNPLQFSEALKFALIFSLIYGAANWVRTHYGEAGIYVVAFFSGLSDVDAITLSLSSLAAEGRLAPLVALKGILLAGVVNSAVKLGIALAVGKHPQLAKHVGAYFILTLGALALAWLVIPWRGF